GFDISFSENTNQINVVLPSEEIDSQKLFRCLQGIEKLFPNKQISIQYASKTVLTDEFLTQYGKNINTLDLRAQGNNVSDSDLEKLMKYCPNIQNLSIKSNRISSVGIAALSSSKNLIKLDLSGCKALTSVEDLNKLKSLKEINLS